MELLKNQMTLTAYDKCRRCYIAALTKKLPYTMACDHKEHLMSVFTHDLDTISQSEVAGSGRRQPISEDLRGCLVQ